MKNLVFLGEIFQTQNQAKDDQPNLSLKRTLKVEWFIGLLILDNQPNQ